MSDDREDVRADEPATPAEEARPRRYRADRTTEAPSGYRASRRTSRSAKQARKAKRAQRIRGRVSRAGRTALDLSVLGAKGIAALALTALAIGLALLLVAQGMNGIVRWIEKRSADRKAPAAAADERSKDNLLVIGVEEDRAVGLLALRIEPSSRRVFGIAIPEGAFVEVPGQGFERIGDSFSAGADVSEAAVTNYLTVPFENHVVVDASAYQEAVKRQSLKGLMDGRKETDLTAKEVRRFSQAFDTANAKEVALVPLPVRPINVGEQMYLEPERDKVADLLLTWWDVKLDKDSDEIRVIIYNGAGVPGIAGQAAQQLIKQGFRVVETRNAESFGYKRTRILLYHGKDADGERVKRALGVGTVYRQESDEDVTDIIVIIGKDYAPSGKDG